MTVLLEYIYLKNNNYTFYKIFVCLIKVNEYSFSAIQPLLILYGSDVIQGRYSCLTLNIWYDVSKAACKIES